MQGGIIPDTPRKITRFRRRPDSLKRAAFQEGIGGFTWIGTMREGARCSVVHPQWSRPPKCCTVLRTLGGFETQRLKVQAQRKKSSDNVRKLHARGGGKRNSNVGFLVLINPATVYTIGARLNCVICSRCGNVFARGARVKLDLQKRTKPNGIMHEVCPRKGLYA